MKFDIWSVFEIIILAECIFRIIGGFGKWFDWIIIAAEIVFIATRIWKRMENRKNMPKGKDESREDQENE